jgi:hypothetical protein
MIRLSQSGFVPMLFLLLILLLSLVIGAHSQSRNYTVTRKGGEIGWVSLEKKTDSNGTLISFASEVRTSFIITFSSSAKEISEFRDGKLQHSYFYRTTNGNIKADRHTRFTGNNYEVDNPSSNRKLNIPPVTYNTLCMYFQEPVGIKQVYSDNCQCLLDITKEADGSYSITTDGATNQFYYLYGICYRVKIDSRFYSATLHLR